MTTDPLATLTVGPGAPKTPNNNSALAGGNYSLPTAPGSNPPVVQNFLSSIGIGQPPPPTSPVSGSALDAFGGDGSKPRVTSSGGVSAGTEGAPTSFSVDTSNNPSTALSSDTTSTQTTNQNNTYLDYARMLANATQYSPEYLAAYGAAKSAANQGYALSGEYAASPGDFGATVGQASGLLDRYQTANRAAAGEANVALSAEDLKRQGDIAGATALEEAYKPVGVSPGTSLVSPASGQPVYGGTSAYTDYQAQQGFYSLSQQYPDVAIPYNPALTPQQNFAAMQNASQNSQLFYKKGYIAPNAFTMFGGGSANPLQPEVQSALGPGANNVLSAIQSGLLSPTAINSRTAPIYGAIYAANPNFNAVQATGAASFYESQSTQQKLAWAATTEKDFGTLRDLSSKVPRSELPLVNQALLGAKVNLGDPNATAFVQAASRVASSLSNVLGDSGGSDFRTRLASGVLDPAFSPDTFDKVLGTESQLITNLVSSFKQQGNQPATPATSSTSAAPGWDQI